MPGRKHPLLIDHIYHVYNKSIGSKYIFSADSDNRYFLEVMSYYRSQFAIMRYSKFKMLKPENQLFALNQIHKRSTFQVSILAYCLMPTHFHLLLRQNKRRGISNFISKIQNSYTRYFNIKYKINGPLFLDRFKSKPITSDDLLKHVSRYIHLNPYSGEVINTVDKLQSYPWSSFKDYLKDESSSLCEPNFVLSLFNDDKERYKKFVLENADHQKMLEYCKYSDC